MALLTLLACVFSEVAAAPGVTRSELAGGHRGLSGLTVDDAGRLWSVTERGVALVPLRVDGDRVVPDGDPLRVRGWPFGVDAESIAWLGPGRFALGGEGHVEGRGRDVVREVLVADGVARVGREWALPYGPFGASAGGNQGIEGLDASGGVLVAASEVVVTGAGGTGESVGGVVGGVGTGESAGGARGAARAALLWRLGEDDAVAYARVGLTSADGKVSTVVAEDGGARVLAVERHYGTVRLVEADVTWGPAHAPGWAEARVVRDLAAELGGLPNLEGLARLADGRIVLLSDNQGGAVVSGPTTAIVVEAGAGGAPGASEAR